MNVTMLILATLAGVLLGGPGWFLVGRASATRSKTAFNAGAAAAGVGFAGTRFDVTSDVQQGPLVTRLIAPTHEGTHDSRSHA